MVNLLVNLFVRLRVALAGHRSLLFGALFKVQSQIPALNNHIIITHTHAQLTHVLLWDLCVQEPPTNIQSQKSIICRGV